MTKLPITAGEQVISNKFVVQRKPARFHHPAVETRRCHHCQRVIGAGGLIVPGDYVDVIGVFDKETMGKDMAAIIRQNMLVLSVAQSIEGELPRRAKDPGPAGW